MNGSKKLAQVVPDYPGKDPVLHARMDHVVASALSGGEVEGNPLASPPWHPGLTGLINPNLGATWPGGIELIRAGAATSVSDYHMETKSVEERIRRWCTENPGASYDGRARMAA